MDKDLKDKDKNNSINEKPKRNKEDEPSWYHYLIVIAVIFIIFYGISYFTNFSFTSNTNNIENLSTNYSEVYNNDTSNQPYVLINETTNETTVILPLNLSKNYLYKKKIGNEIFNLNFNSPVDEVENYETTIEVSKIELLNSNSLTLSFLDYNGIDNMYVSTASVKLMKLLRYLYKLKFTTENFRKYEDINCANSTLENKVIVFDPYQKELSGVFYNTSNGCIRILSTTPSQMVSITDKLLYELVNE